jgi:hypothetical protein
MKKSMHLILTMLILLVAVNSYATTTLTLTDISGMKSGGGFLDPIVVSNTSGIISLNQTFGHFSITITSAFAPPTLGTVFNPEQHLNLVALSLNPIFNGIMTFDVTTTDLISPMPSGYVIPGFRMSGGGITHGSMLYSAYVNYPDQLIGSLSFDNSGAGGSFVGSTFTSLSLPNPGFYSITQRVTLSHLGISTSSGDFEVTPVPEPGSLILIGSGLTGLALLKKLRKRSK